MLSVVFFVPTSKDLLTGALRPAVAIRAAIRFRNRLAKLVDIAIEERLAPLLARREVPISLLPAIGSRLQSADIDNQVGQGNVVVVFGTPEIFLRSWSALGGKVGIAAIPLKRFGIPHIFDGPVVHNVAAESVRLQIPGKPVEGGIDMAVCAPDLALERVTCRIKRLLAIAKYRYLLWTGQRNRRGHSIGLPVDHADRIFKPVGHQQLLPVVRKCQSARVMTDCNPRHHVVGACR